MRQWTKKIWSVYISTVYTSTLDRILIISFLGCAVVILAHDVVPRFVGWAEMFPGGAELWELLYELCLAFVASYVFYFVVVHLKRQRDREVLKPFLYRYTSSIVDDAKLISQKLANASETEFEGDFPPDRDVVVEMCERVNPISKVPGMFIVQWFEFLEFRRSLSKESSANILTATPFLEPEHLKRVMDVDTCLYFKRVQAFANNFRRPDEPTSPTSIHPHTNLGVLDTDFQDYFEKAKRLKEYVDNELSSD